MTVMRALIISALLLPCALIGAGCAESRAADMSDVTSRPSDWVEVYSDDGARRGATFQSHVRKLRDHDGALTLAYTHQGEEHAHNRVVRIPHGGRARTVAKNDTPSNADCIVVWDDRVRHVYADFKAKALYVDALDGSAPKRFEGFHTAGKTTCQIVGDDLLVSTSYGEVWRLRDTEDDMVPTVIRKRLVLDKPESAQYPHIVDGLNDQGGVTVMNTSSMVGFYYRDLYVSECNAEDVCEPFAGTFPMLTRAANSWVGDVARLNNGSLVAYWTENDHHFAPERVFSLDAKSRSYLGVMGEARWEKVDLGDRILSARFLRREGELLLVTMGRTGEVFVERVEGGSRDIGDVLKDGPELMAYQNLKVACAYALDADLAENVLSLALTDRGADCAADNGTVRVWRHALK